MLLTVVETPMYLRYAAAIWSDDERSAFVDFIAANPNEGAVIPKYGPLRKVRWTRPGTGKRGGARVIYYVVPAAGTVFLLMAYPKSTDDSLSAAFLKKLRNLLE